MYKPKEVLYLTQMFTIRHPCPPCSAEKRKRSKGIIPRFGNFLRLLTAPSSHTSFKSAANPGVWMYHCHVNDHLTAGMMNTFTVRNAQ
ncbi:MAG: multicopper oxidase domain-containing protein [Gammaproteobacteria bacterium]